MKRFFNKYQRQLIRIMSGNICTICGDKLNDDFHADHKIPFSQNGKTTLANGQALCPHCNLKKGSKL